MQFNSNYVKQWNDPIVCVKIVNSKLKLSSQHKSIGNNKTNEKLTKNFGFISKNNIILKKISVVSTQVKTLLLNVLLFLTINAKKW